MSIVGVLKTFYYKNVHRLNLMIMIKIIMNINSLWISTTPRTGSMWLYNVTREILKFSKINVLPTKIPKSSQEFFEIFEKQSLIDQNDSNKYAFKIHKILKPDLPRSKVLTTIRDPRDICISFKEFMKTDFDTALKAAKSLLKIKTQSTDLIDYDKNNNDYKFILGINSTKNRFDVAP